MKGIRFFLHDDEKTVGLTTKKALDAFYSYVLDGNGDIIKKFVDDKEYRLMLNSGHKFDFTEDQVCVTTPTPEESPFPFTEYGKTVTLSPSAVEDEQRNKIANLAEKFIGLSMILSILAIVCGAITIIPVVWRHV